jgi:hypothetical protein
MNIANRLADAVSFELDDCGMPNDNAAKFFRDHGLDAAGNAPAPTDDIMSRGARISQRCDDADRLGFLEWAQTTRGVGREAPDVTLDRLERDLDAKISREREHIARREWIRKICAPVTSPAERLRRVRRSLVQLQKARSKDTRAIIAACAYGDMMEIPAISAHHRLDLLSFCLSDDDGGRCARTVFAVVKRGRLLVDDLARHALPATKAVSLSIAQKGKRVRPNIRKAVHNSLHDSAVAVEAISRLSPKDQATVAAAIERHVMLAELEAREDIDAKAGLHKLPCAILDDLDFAKRNDSITRRQLAKLRPAEQRYYTREMAVNKLDGPAEMQTLNESVVAEYVGAFRAFAKSYRSASDTEIRAAKRKAKERI